MALLLQRLLLLPIGFGRCLQVLKDQRQIPYVALWITARAFLDGMYSYFLECCTSLCSHRAVFCGVLVTGHRRRVNILKQWDIRRSLCFLNHKHLSLHFYSRNVLFEILLGCGKDLLLVAAAFAC